MIQSINVMEPQIYLCFLTPSRASVVLMLPEVVQLKNRHIKLNNWSISITLMQKKITLVMDNLNTHVGASLYKTFKPQEARRILDKVDFHYTPKHGSWLNMAEIEFSILGRECLDRRIEDKVMLQKEVAAWTNDRNSKKSKITWRFKNEEVRIKLKRLYPLLE